MNGRWFAVKDKLFDYVERDNWVYNLSGVTKLLCFILLTASVMFTYDIRSILFVLVLQQVDGNVRGPKILGDATGLSSFWVIVAILVGGGFGGVLGMFLGVPIFACIYAFVTFLVKRRMNALDPDETLFAPGVAAPLPVKSPVVKDRERAKAKREAEERAEQDAHSDAE